MRYFLTLAAACCLSLQSFAQRRVPPPPIAPLPIPGGTALSVDQQPEFPGGINALNNFLATNINFPDGAKIAGVDGRVIAQFMIGKDGVVRDIKIVHDLGYGTGAEVVRVLKKMPKWKPARHNNKAVAYKYSIPVRFYNPEEKVVSLSEESPPPMMAPPPPKMAAPQAVDPNEILDQVDKQAEFPGGSDALWKYLGKKIEFPAEAQEADAAGRVYVKFVVERDGSITDIKIIKDFGYGSGKEVVRVVKGMPRWAPAMKDGKAVRSHFNLPVIFRQ